MEREHLPILKNLGLAARARRMTFGSEMTIEAIRAGKVSLVLLCESASPNTAKKIRNCCEQCSVRYFTVPIDAGELAHAVGKTKPLMTVGITDDNLSVLVQSSLIGLTERKASSQTVSESEV